MYQLIFKMQPVCRKLIFLLIVLACDVIGQPKKAKYSLTERFITTQQSGMYLCQ